MATEPVVGPPEEESDQDIEARYPDAVRERSSSPEVPNEHATETDPAVPPPQPTNG